MLTYPPPPFELLPFIKILLSANYLRKYLALKVAKLISPLVCVGGLSPSPQNPSLPPFSLLGNLRG
jgi:hypothetical protein